MIILRTLCVASICAVVTACSGTSVKEERQSGFIPNYTQLEAVELPSETQAWRWVAPEFNPRDYRAVRVLPVVYKPQPEAGDQISAEVLAQIRDEINAVLAAQVDAAEVPLRSENGAGVLTLRPVISSVSLSLQKMKINEVIPIRLLLSGAELALGKRDQDVTFLFEYQLVDSLTGELMVSGVRHANTQPLSDDKEQLQVQHAKVMLDKLKQDLAQNFGVLKQELEEGSH